MGIVLVPAVYVINEKPTQHVPIGLLSIATVLRNSHYNVSIVDINATSEDCLYEDSASCIVSGEPSVIGFSTMCSSYHTTLRIAQECKRIHPEAQIILGGPQASITAEATMREFTFLDAIVCGEGENSICSLVEALHNNDSLHSIPGVVFRFNNDIIANDCNYSISSDIIPSLDYSLYLNNYVVNREKPFPIEIGRGCPYNCTFCSTSKFWQGKTRYRSSQSIIQSIKELKERYGFNNFEFVHDNFTASPELVTEILNGLKVADLNVVWSASCRVDALDKSLIDRMSSGGCYKIFLGIESGSQRIQREIGKNINLDKVYNTIKYLTELNIATIVSFISGIPFETASDISDTLNLIFAINYGTSGLAICQYHLLAPLPGTHLYDKYRDTLNYDGFTSDLTLNNKSMCATDVAIIKMLPHVFSAFYHYSNNNISRFAILEITQLVRAMRIVMKMSGTVLWNMRTLDLSKLIVDYYTTRSNEQIHLPLSNNLIEQIEWCSAQLIDILQENGFANEKINMVIEQEKISESKRALQTI